MIFVKSVSRARELDRLLVECNFPSIAIHAGLKQPERIACYKKFKVPCLSFGVFVCSSLLPGL